MRYGMEDLGVKRALVLLIMLTGCASVPKTYEWNWVRIWNEATTLGGMEKAAALMEKNNYVRYSEQVVRNYVNPNLGSTPVYDVEREMIYFSLAAQYLWEYQAGGEHFEQMNVYARKLSGVPGLHTMSKFLIARVQELNGGSYNPHYVPVPTGAKMWFFSVGRASGAPTEVKFEDFKADYERLLHEKQGGHLGRGSQAACAAVLLCFMGISSDDDLVLQDLRSSVYLDVTDKQGKPVMIGVSAWLAKSL